MLLKRLFCKHTHKECLTNIHGDLINQYDCRSIWRCQSCGKLIKSDELNKNCKVVNFIEKGDLI